MITHFSYFTIFVDRRKRIVDVHVHLSILHWQLKMKTVCARLIFRISLSMDKVLTLCTRTQLQITAFCLVFFLAEISNFLCFGMARYRPCFPGVSVILAALQVRQNITVIIKSHVCHIINKTRSNDLCDIHTSSLPTRNLLVCQFRHVVILQAY